MVSRSSLFLVLAACVLTPSCNYYKHTKLASFDLAMQRPSRTQNPPVFHASGVPNDLPGATAYAIINGDFDGGGSDEKHASLLKRQAATLGFAPDYLIYTPQGSVYAGSVSTYVGFGITTSSPITRPQGVALCMREVGFSTGLDWDSNNMVTDVNDQVRSIGIQEGDTLVSIAGATVKASGSQPSPWAADCLKHKPGDVVRMIWIRPGQGRMEGQATLLPPRAWPVIRSFTQDYESRLQEGINRDKLWRNGT